MTVDARLSFKEHLDVALKGQERLVYLKPALLVTLPTKILGNAACHMDGEIHPALLAS